MQTVFGCGFALTVIDVLMFYCIELSQGLCSPALFESLYQVCRLNFTSMFRNGCKETESAVINDRCAFRACLLHCRPVTSRRFYFRTR